MKKSVLIVLFLFVFLGANRSIGQVGIGTSSPKAFFNVARSQTVLFGEDTSQVGSANKLIWYASQGAFRAGYVDNDAWSRSSASDNTNIGRYSFGSGYNSRASGSYSTALGNNSYAGGNASTAMGSQTNASGGASTAMGYKTRASGAFSTALGTYVSTNQQQGSFILGDFNINSTATNNDAANQMMMRFAGGYKLFTNFEATLGVSLSSGGNAWQTLSDSTRKENFRSVDGAGFLEKIAQLKLGSWNYKGQDAKQYRHYGPMAQDCFAAFGHDTLGNIGEDKSINQADFDGVNLIAIQALIRKVEKLEAQNKILREENAALKSDTQARLDKIEAALQGQPISQTLTLKP
ncbi:tail fiber domain-containing protein [Spirosoma validum]|uniref:Tail fiber domain-containing protein n=1 Tax=Spirosoma validum TaxID=2771355 RepID=A0A927GG61_9BACT|nr:tail fiber domain-containing protein [Spirosoma validum]MBD2756549.1 tail fiber domain-containing protein [Spirosoma validum]